MRRRRLERVERSAIILASNGLSDKKDDFESDLENV
jgi:hypothetical protein